MLYLKKVPHFLNLISFKIIQNLSWTVEKELAAEYNWKTA